MTLVPSPPAAERPWLSHRAITLPYTIVAVAWIAVTDTLVMVLVDDAGVTTPWQMAKGWVFVGITSLLLALLVHRATARIRHTSSERDEYMRRLTTLLQNLPGMVYCCENDTTWRMHRIEGDCEQLTGYAATELLSGKTSYADVIHPDDRQAVFERVQEVAERGPFELRYRIVRKDGEVRTVQEHGCAVEKSEGKATLLEGYVYDITELAHYEESIQRLNKMGVLERVVGCAAHDFSNFLMVISSASDTLRSEPLTPAGRAELEALDQATAAAGRLTRKLLTFSRHDPSPPERIDLATFLRDRSDLFQSMVGRRTTFEMHVDPETPVLVANASELEQVVTNLLLNAADAAGPGGNVRLRAGMVSAAHDEFCQRRSILTGHFARIRVEDDGIGMDEEIRAQLFVPFFTTKGARGTGLGLSSVYGIVKELTGAISVESEPGAGARFDIYLPCTPPSVPTSDR